MGYGTDGLTFNTLRGANVARLPEFKDSHGRPAHSFADGSDWSPGEWVCAVTGELGELANIIKKVKRGDLTMIQARSAISDELADVVCYLDILAMQVGVDLGEAVIGKFNRVSERVRSSVQIDHAGWHRVERR
jgi:NTP pyrophosphatase (non-canonical NTP hydrolase)